jgi:hypothetical protein
MLALISQGALGQVEVRGTVYDRSQLFAMPGVSVLGTSGGGTMTDSNGHYSIRANPGDSIYFYRYDSSENREEYRRVFDYQPDGIIGGASGGVGLNLDMLFSARKNRQMLALQRRLIEEEQDKYVDHRFNKTLVKKITGLQRPALDTFMRIYRPSYEFIQNCENDYEFYKYIKDCGLYFSRIWKEEHPG